MKNLLAERFVPYGKYTIEATALKLDTSWYPQYKILGQLSASGGYIQSVSTGYASCEAAVDFAVQRAMFELDFGKNIPA